MIVVDTNVIASLFLNSERSEEVEALLRSEPRWAAPTLWRSELRNVLALYVRTQRFDLAYAMSVFDAAAQLMGEEEYSVPTLDVLSHAKSSGCSAYDCEFVALADGLGVPLVTLDREVLTAFPGIATGLDNIVAH